MIAPEILEAQKQVKEVNLDKYDFKTNSKLAFKAAKGLTKETILEMSRQKKEPDWMLELRLKAFEEFQKRPLPTWGPDLSELKFDEITYYLKPGDQKATDWNDVPIEIRETFDKLGIPEFEKKYLAGSVAQYESESVYHSLKKEWDSKGVIFCDMDTAVQKHPDLVKKYFMKCVPYTDNKFAALHAAVHSGGSFAYIPPGVHVDMPLQTYFRMNAEAEGQFEHTLIIADEGSSVTYQEGCTAPKYSKDSLHAAVVEIYVKKNAKARYLTVQNWSKNVYNLNTKRAVVEGNGQMSWIGGSLGSKTTMLYPCTILKGDNSTASHLNIAFGTGGTWKDGGAKVIHVGKNTSSKVVAKSISMGGGVSVYRGLMRIQKGAENAKAHVQCDGLILDETSRSDAFPHNEIYEPTATVAHEASVGRISDDQLFYLMSRGLNDAEARSMIVLGFLDDVMREIPLEFSVEMNRLIQMEMSKLGAVG